MLGLGRRTGWAEVPEPHPFIPPERARPFSGSHQGQSPLATLPGLQCEGVTNRASAQTLFEPWTCGTKRKSTTVPGSLEGPTGRGLPSGPGQSVPGPGTGGRPPPTPAE